MQLTRIDEPTPVGGIYGLGVCGLAEARYRH